MEIPMIAYLVVSTIMFFAGVYGFVTRKNMLAMLISLELMLNAVDINFVVFNRYLYPEALEGFFFTLFAIGIAAAETALALCSGVQLFYHAPQCRRRFRYLAADQFRMVAFYRTFAY